MTDKPNLFKRILLSIPFCRHRFIKMTIKAEQESNKMVDLCNRVISRKIAPEVVRLVSCGKIDTSTFENLEYFKKLIAQLFGKKSDIFASQLKIERVLHSIPGIYIRILLMPSEGEVGQSIMVAFVYGDKTRCAAYSLEYSIGKQMAVCEWVEEKHFNYGFVSDKKHFVSKVIEIYKSVETAPSNEVSYISLKEKYDYLIEQDYYNTLTQDKIGKCKAIGFKQEYDRALFNIASEITSSKDFAMSIMNNLYSKIYYPVSDTPVALFKQHVTSSVGAVAKSDSHLRQIIKQNGDIVGLIFNLWLSQMVVHEEATDELNRIYEERAKYHD